MFYIIGSAKQVEEFKANHNLPYFRYEENDAYTGEAHLFSEDDEAAVMYVAIESGTYTVAAFDAETGGYSDEREFDSYEDALAYYNELDA